MKHGACKLISTPLDPSGSGSGSCAAAGAITEVVSDWALPPQPQVCHDPPDVLFVVTRVSYLTLVIRRLLVTARCTL